MLIEPTIFWRNEIVAPSSIVDGYHLIRQTLLFAVICL